MQQPGGDSTRAASAAGQEPSASSQTRARMSMPSSAAPPAPSTLVDRVNPVRIQRRLLLMLIVPLALLALLNGYMDYRSADNSASEQDQQLLRLVPLLADSIIAVGAHSGDPPVLLLAPPVEEFLKEREGLVSYKVYTPKRKLLHGDDKLPSVVPLTQEPEFFNQEVKGVNYRMVVQRVPSVAGDVIVEVADASDPRKRWLQQVLVKVLLPNLFLIAVVGLGISWAVQRALRPLRDLILAVERRSPRDLNSIDERSSPMLPTSCAPLWLVCRRRLRHGASQSSGSSRMCVRRSAGVWPPGIRQALQVLRGACPRRKVRDKRWHRHPPRRLALLATSLWRRVLGLWQRRKRGSAPGRVLPIPLTPGRQKARQLAPPRVTMLAWSGAKPCRRRSCRCRWRSSIACVRPRAARRNWCTSCCPCRARMPMCWRCSTCRPWT